MHELSLCEAILNHVEERVGDRPVRRVEVRIGHLRQVVPDALMFSWEMLTECSGRTGCELVVEHIPAVVRCRACGVDTTLEWPVLACATCESHEVELRSGDELELAWIDVRSGDVSRDDVSSGEVSRDDVTRDDVTRDDVTEEVR